MEQLQPRVMGRLSTAGHPAAMLEKTPDCKASAPSLMLWLAWVLQKYGFSCEVMWNQVGPWVLPHLN